MNTERLFSYRSRFVNRIISESSTQNSCMCIFRGQWVTALSSLQLWTNADISNTLQNTTWHKTTMQYFSSQLLWDRLKRCNKKPSNFKKIPHHDSRHQTSLLSLPKTSPPGLPVYTKMPRVKNCVTMNGEDHGQENQIVFNTLSTQIWEKINKTKPYRYMQPQKRGMKQTTKHRSRM